MGLVRKIVGGVKALLGKRRVERELDEELRNYLEAAAAEKMTRGMSGEEAVRAARVEMGSLEGTKEIVRSARWERFAETCWQDLRFGVRMLRKSPGFTAAAVVTLALGIGANTAVFSAVNAILLQPPPYPEPSRIVTIGAYKRLAAPGVVGYVGLSPDAWSEIVARTPAIMQLGTYDQTELTTTGGAEPEKLAAAKVCRDFFSVFGTQPLFGRVLFDSDCRRGTSDIVVLGYLVWRSALGGDSSSVGRKIFLNGRPYTVVGVMPPDFRFGVGERGVWIPAPDPTEAASAVARLNPDVSVEQADAQLQVASQWFAQKYPTLLKSAKLTANPVGTVDGELRTSLLLLFGAVGLVLLIACANVCGLLIVRGSTRLQELAIRQALGASRNRLLRQLLVESVVLSSCGGALAVALATWGIRVVRAVAPPGTPNLEHLSISPTVFLFTATASVFASVLFGVAPAFHFSGHPAGARVLGISGIGNRARPGKRPRWLGGALVITEVALAVIVVVSAALVSRTFAKLVSIRTGFRTDHVLSLTMNFSPGICDPNNRNRTVQCSFAISEVLRRIRALPDVRSAAFTSRLPLNGASGVLSLRVEGRPSLTGIQYGALLFSRAVSRDYFQTLGMPIVAGRDFAQSDTLGSQPVALVNDSFARLYFSGKPLGKRIKRESEGDSPWIEIVGEVPDTRDFSLFERPVPEFYVPAAQASFLGGTALLVRTNNDPSVVLAAVRQSIWDVDKDAPVTDVKTVRQILAEQVAEPRFRTILLAFFGLLSLLLAMTGIYGVISYLVAQRTQEIGVRMALGARRGQIWRMVMGKGMFLVGTGLAIGLAASAALTRFMQSLLYEVRSGDPGSFVGASLLIAAASVLACYLPARRAMQVDPMVALRCE